MGNLSFDYECSARDTTNRATPLGTDTPPKKTKSWEWDESPDPSYEQIKSSAGAKRFLGMQAKLHSQSLIHRQIPLR